jgi:iron complex outermembrane receptor protein
MTGSFDRGKSPCTVWGVSLIVLACALSLASPAAAQDARSKDDAPAATDQEIVVTAQFRNQRLQDVPLAITALSGDSLEARSQTSLTDLRAPNLKIEQPVASQGPAAQIFIRGVGQYDSNFSFEPGVGVYIDDVYYATLFGNQFKLLDLDRVEVLRGPQGTLAGQNSIGGALKLYSKKPSGDGGGYVELGTGSFNLMSLRAAGDITVVPDKVFARISGMGQHVTGYVDRVDYKCTHPASALPTYATDGNSCLLGHQGGGNEVGGRAQLRMLPVDGLEINLSADYYMMRGDPGTSILIEALAAAAPVVNGVTYGPAFLAPDHYTSYATYRGTATSGYTARPASDLTSWGVAGSFEYSFSDAIKLTSITAYRSANGYFAEDNDVSPIPKSETQYSPRQNQFTQEVRLNVGVGKLADVTVGGFYYKGDALNAFRALVASTNADSLGADTIKSRTRSAFAHAVVHVTDKLNLTGGVRYTEDRKTYTFVRRTPDGSYSASVTPINGQSGTFDKGVWDFRAVADYRWSSHFFTYVQFSTGFKGGGVNPRVFFQNQIVPFDEEKLRAYEAGFKGDLFDRRLRFSVAAFRNSYSGLQSRTTTAFFNVNLPVQPDSTLPNYNPVGGTSPAAVYLNAGDIRQKGFEAEATLTPVEGLEIDGSLSYLKGHYVNLLPQAVASGLTLSMKLPFAPEWQANAGIQYALPFAGGTLTPRLDYVYQSTSFASAVNHPRNLLEARNVFNARLAYRTGDGNWEAAVAVTNITNDFYYYSKNDILGAGGYVTGSPARPRQWSLSLKRNF